MGLGAPSAAPKKLSTVGSSTVLDIAVEDGRRLLLVGAGSSAQVVALPTPEFGAGFRLVLTADAVGTATIITASSAFDIIMAGSTYYGIQFDSTAEEGQAIELVGLSDTRYLARPQALSSAAGGVWAGITT